MAVEGMQNLRRGLEVKMHTVVNDVARDIVDSVNKVEPKFKAKADQTGSGPMAAQVTVTGSAELPKDKKSQIVRSIEDAIENAMGR